MTATHVPGVPVIADGILISTSPATGEEIARLPVADAAAVAAAVQRARPAAQWWAELGFAGRRETAPRIFTMDSTYWPAGGWARNSQ